MSRRKLIVRTDEELSASNPELVRRQMRRERIKKGLLTAGYLAAAATSLWIERKREGKSKGS
jgi:hypothetical protein